MSAAERQPLDYERVRSELAERGYLGGRVGRFVLQEGARRRRSPRLLRTAMKAAILGAPVLALLLAATVARDNRPLIAPRDFPLLWLYFTPLCGAALFVLDAAVGWISGRLSGVFGIRGGETTRAALLAGVPTVLYLFLLGRHSGGSQGLAIESAFFALGVLVVVFVSWLAGLVSVAGILGRTGEVTGRRARSLRTLFIVIPLAMLAVTVLRLSSEWRSAEGVPPDFEIVPAARFVFLGIDGMDGEWVESLEPSGAVGRLLELMASGVVVPLQAETRGEPPEVWTSMLTGVTGSVHGLRSAGAEVFPGMATPLSAGSGRLPWVSALRLAFPSRTVPASGTARRVHTVWEIVGQRRRALSVGWWGSWPAGGTPDAPWVVSDRVLPKLLSDAEFDRDAWPEALYARMRGAFDETRIRLHAEFDAMFPDLETDVRRLVWESYLIDAFHAWTLREFWDSAAIESAFVYFPGLEILKHRAPGAGMSVIQQAALFEGYTRWLDGAIATVVDEVGEAATVMVVGDPGRDPSPTAEPFAVVRSGAVTGPCVDTPRGALTVASVALALNGFPLSAELPDLETAGCLAPIAASSATIPSYGRKPVDTREAVSAYDEEMVKRLRSLGYLN